MYQDIKVMKFTYQNNESHISWPISITNKNLFNRYCYINYSSLLGAQSNQIAAYYMTTWKLHISHSLKKDK